MAKMRPNPAYAGPKKGERRKARKRIRVKPRPSAVKVWDISCQACKRKFELAYTGEVNCCIFCASTKIEKTERTRAETKAERAQRNREFAFRAAQTVLGFMGQFFRFERPPNGFYPPAAPSTLQPDSELQAELMKEGYKKLAMKYHPDKGGDPEKMKELNRLKEKLGL